MPLGFSGPRVRHGDPGTSCEAAELMTDLERIYQRTKAADKELRELLAATGSMLTELHGIGPSGAARLLVEVGDITRFPDRAHFASWNGTAPIDASSGDQVRHRLSRAGNRRINHALHMMAVTQIRYPATPGRTYYERKRREGKTPKEALRCLKRRLSDLVYYQLLADRRGTIGACGSPTTPPPTRSTSTSPAARSRRAAPPSKRPRRPAPPGSSHWTGKTAASLALRSSTPAPASTTTSSNKPKSTAKTAPS